MTPLALLLAWLFVNEASFHGTLDHAAIFHALRNRSVAMGWTMTDTVTRYTSGRLARPDTPRSRWITSLREDGGRPDFVSNSRGPAWTDDVADNWKAVLVRARRWVRHPPRNPCNGGDQEHWAGQVAIDRTRAATAMEANRWSMVYCGHTRNRFYAVNRHVRQWVRR